MPALDPTITPKTVDDRYQVFASEFVIDHNATRAALAAGYGPKLTSAASKGSQLLRKAKVQRYVHHYESLRAQRVGVRQDRVLEEIQRLAMANAADIYIEQDGQLVVDPRKLRLPDGSLNRDVMAAITEVKTDTTGGANDGERRLVLRTTVKLADKVKSLDMLMRHLGAYNDKMKIEGLQSLPEILAMRWGSERPPTADQNVGAPTIPGTPAPLPAPSVER